MHLLALLEAEVEQIYTYIQESKWISFETWK